MSGGWELVMEDWARTLSFMMRVDAACGAIHDKSSNSESIKREEKTWVYDAMLDADESLA